jgi:hypothetical protein
MLNRVSRMWLIGAWIALLAVIVTISVAMGASLSTTSLLFALGVAPGAVMAMLRAGASSPTVAEILHTVDSKDRP